MEFFNINKNNTVTVKEKYREVSPLTYFPLLLDAKSILDEKTFMTEIINLEKDFKFSFEIDYVQEINSFICILRGYKNNLYIKDLSSSLLNKLYQTFNIDAKYLMRILNKPNLDTRKDAAIKFFNLLNDENKLMLRLKY